ncbi:MAG: histidine phosphatase family protein [Pseudomonadota bacterium]
MSQIYFIRHGQASFGTDNYDRLSDLGRVQSVIVGDFFAQTKVVFDGVYSGSLERQTETAALALARLPGGAVRSSLEIWPEFDEYSSDPVITTLLPVVVGANPELEPLVERMSSDRRSFQVVFEKVMDLWVSGQVPVSEGESFDDFSQRVSSGVRKLMAVNGRKKNLAVFSSGGAIAAVMMMALGLAGRMAVKLNWLMKNASITTFFYNDSELMLSSFNSTAHLEAKNEAGLITYR